ncbi:MAG: GTPase [Planctomycetota bacterium]
MSRDPRSRTDLGYRWLTPPGAAALALLELEGEGARAWLEARFRPQRAARAPLPPLGTVTLGELRDPDGEALDQVLLARTAPSRFELSCHGGAGVRRALERALSAAGGRELAREMATAADRVAAEAWAALPTARTELGCQVLLRQAQGALAAGLDPIRAAIAAGELPSATASLARLAATLRLGRALLDPPRVALLGAPNAGKSTLLNALVGRARALVSPAPGTTRDLVEAEAELAGLPVRLIDTAGQRETGDPLEAAGVDLARAAGGEAALRLWVIDSTGPAPSPPPELEALVVWNKQDRPGAAPPPAGAYPVSALTGAGLPALGDAIRRDLVGEVDPSGPVLFTLRQAGLVTGALRALEAGAPPRAARCLHALLG